MVIMLVCVVQLSITWPNVRGSDLFNLVASDMYVVVKTQDNPNGELLGWFQCDRMPFEKDCKVTVVCVWIYNNYGSVW